MATYLLVRKETPNANLHAIKTPQKYPPGDRSLSNDCVDVYVKITCTHSLTMAVWDDEFVEDFAFFKFF